MLLRGAPASVGRYRVKLLHVRNRREALAGERTAVCKEGLRLPNGEKRYAFELSMVPGTGGWCSSTSLTIVSSVFAKLCHHLGLAVAVGVAHGLQGSRPEFFLPSPLKAQILRV